MNILKEYQLFVKRIGLFGVTNLLVALSSLILLPIMTKTFPINDYGIWVQINTTISLIPNLATLGLSYSMFRFLSGERDKEKIREEFYSIAIIVLFSTIIISSLIFLFSRVIASALFDGNVNIVILLSLIIFFACMDALLLSYFRTFQQMKRYSLFLLIQTYLGLIIVSYFALKGFSITIASSGLLIANLVTFFIMISLVLLDIGFKLPKLKNIREYLSFGLPTIPSTLSYWIVDSSDRYLIGILLGTAFVGYYSPGYTLGNIILIILAPFSFLLPSLLPKYYDDNNIEQVRIYLKYSLKYFLLIAIPSGFGLSILSKQILMILTTPSIALNGYFITPFVVLSATLFGFYGIISNIIILEKKTKITGMIWIIAAIMNLGLNILIIPHFGIIGAAITTLIAYIIAFALTVFYSHKFFKLDFDIPFIFKSIIASILMSIFLIIFHPTGLFNLILSIPISIIIYFILITLLKGIKKSEINFIKTLFKSHD